MRTQINASWILLHVQESHSFTFPGQPSELDIGISPVEAIAVDMYLLMDLSLTMQQDLNMIRMFAGTLGKKFNFTTCIHLIM